MKCILYKSTEAFSEIHFTDTDSEDVTIKFSPRHNSVRIEAEHQHGLYFIENQPGILKSKMIYKNAYGMEVGQLRIDHWNNQFLVELDNMLYECSIMKQSNKLLICQRKKNLIVHNCTVEFTDHITVSEKNLSEQTAAIILSACWYLNTACTYESIMQCN